MACSDVCTGTCSLVALSPVCCTATAVRGAWAAQLNPAKVPANSSRSSVCIKRVRLRRLVLQARTIYCVRNSQRVESNHVMVEIREVRAQKRHVTLCGVGQAELKMGGVSNVGIHNLSPGMVTTELLLSGAALPSPRAWGMSVTLPAWLCVHVRTLNACIM